MAREGGKYVVGKDGKAERVAFTRPAQETAADAAAGAVTAETDSKVASAAGVGGAASGASRKKTKE